MKKILQLVGVCCFSMALMSGDVCGVQETKESRELLNPSVMQTALSGLVQEIEKDLRGDSTLRKNVESKVKSFAKKHNLALGIDCFSASGLDVVNELVRATFRATRELMDKSEPSEKMTSILADTCYFLSRELIALDHRSELHPDMFTEILEFSWGNPKLMKIAELVMIDAENGVSDHSMITSAPNTGFELAKRLRNLIFKNPNKYDAAIRGWIEENRSKDWHWKWKSFVELPAFNKPEVIKSLIPLLKRGRNDFRGIDMGTANNVTSLVEFLNFGNCGFGYWWQSFLNSPEYFTELLKSSWGNPELMENTRSLIADAKRGVSNHGEVFDQVGDDEFYLIRHIYTLILGNPDKYDAAIRGWIEENHSKDWHLQWRSFIKLPIFNEPEVIEPLKTVWKARYRFWVTAYGKFFGVTEDRVNSKMKKIAATTSLDGLLK